MLDYGRRFRLDNPLVDFGGDVYQPNEPINCVYDAWGAPLAMLRGLFEYLYSADSLTLIPHIPPGITRLEQRFPVRFGDKQVHLATLGTGPISAVLINGKPWNEWDDASITLPYDGLPDRARLVICRGGAEPRVIRVPRPAPFVVATPEAPFWDLSDLSASNVGNGRPLRLGADSKGASRFLGDMRRARIFSRALSADGIAALAADPGGPSTDSALVADYFMDRLADGACPNPVHPDLPAKVVGTVETVSVDGGKAARFTGDGYFEVPSDPRINLTRAYTLEAWICPDELPDSGARIIDRVTAGVDDGYLLDTHPGNSLRLITEQGSIGYGADLKPGVWVHVAGTFDAREGLALYLDGRQVTSGTAKTRVATDLARVGQFYRRLKTADLEDTFEGQQARLAVAHLAALRERVSLIREGRLPALPDASESAAARCYLEAATRLATGLEKMMKDYEQSADPRKRRLLRIWNESAPPRS